MLSQKLKDEWIAALRSGEYKQGRARLCDRKGGTYCCLGVLAEVIGELQPNGFHIYGSDTYLRKPESTDCKDGMFVTHTYEYIHVPGPAQEKLASLNDEKGSSFADIADYIEKNL